MTSPPPHADSGPGQGTAPVPGLAGAIALYALARFGVVAAIASVLMVVGVPWQVAVLVALIVALPLSMVLFRGLRRRLDGALAEAGSRRSAERAALRARLRGDAPAETDEDPARDGSGEAAERKSDAAGC